VIPKIELPAEELPHQVARLEHALRQTREQIQEVQRHLAQGMGSDEASIFEAHILLLQDPMILEEVTSTISEQHVTAEWAFQSIVEKFGAMLSAVDDEYLRSRAADLRDVSTRVLNNLAGRTDPDALRQLAEPCLIISHDLSPSQTAVLDKKMVLGFATDIGSRTSHTAIMARSLRIPAAVGLGDVSQKLETGNYALLDGYNGVLVVNPTEQTLYEYGQVLSKQVTIQEGLRDILLKPAVTLDGHRILLAANIEQPSDVEQVKSNGAEGVGLFRTEYLFLNRERLPTEQQQYEAYREVAAALKPLPVVIRTLDLGGDKFTAHMPISREMNPFLGWRAIRFCLEQRDIFREQLRAILRASAEGNVKMMYPMISGLEEVKQANALVEEYKQELRDENLPFNENLEIGAMIEIPSAAIISGSLAKRLKFFSIGTNDLIQYTLAVDRMNERIAHLYEPTHPAIIRLIKTTVDAAHDQKIGVSVCGEMAGDPVLAPLLLGLGVDELSASPSLVPSVKFVIRRLKFTEARELAEFALGCESSSEVLARCQELIRNIAPSMFESK
jgi:phosphotransferase system enzyme I (PtsI)